MKNNQPHNKKGFTLVETMVAISVLMFAVLGPLSIASSSLANARTARDQVTAFYLAQEGLEFIRYTRDTNYLLNQENVFSSSPDEDNWLYGIDNCVGTECIVDVDGYFDAGGTPDISDYILPCSGSSCDVPLSIDSLTGLYTYDISGDNRYSPFVRTLVVERVEDNSRGISEDNSEIKVTATVTWNTGLVDKTVTLTEYVSNIYDYE